MAKDEEDTTFDLKNVLKLVGDKILPMILKYFESMMNHVKEPQTLDQIIAVYSPLTSQVILKAKQEENLIYIGGTFKISISDAEHALLKMEAYFKNNQDEWIKKEATASPLLTKFTQEAIEEIKQKGTITFELLDPESKTNHRNQEY